MDDRWQLNEEDIWAEETSAAPEPGHPKPADDLLYGQDPSSRPSSRSTRQAKSTKKTVDELGDKWAKPNTNVELDDGSVSDGDESNWEVRQ